MKSANFIVLGASILALSIISHTCAAQEEGDDAVGRIEFFDQKKAGAFNRPGPSCVLAGNQDWNKTLTNRPRDIRNKKCKNDSIRHIQLRGPIQAGTRIQLFNNGRASTTKPGDSSFAEVQVRSSIGVGQFLIIGSLEPVQINSIIYVKSACNMRSDGRRPCPWMHNDYLDGKVSYIRVIPPGYETDQDVPDIEAAAEQNIYEEPPE